jgi:hypothetical protein
MEWFSVGETAMADEVEDAPTPVRERRTREKKPERKSRVVEATAPVVVEAAAPVAKPERRPRRDYHEQNDAPDHGGFNAGNMPAFLQRPAKTVAP